MVEEVLQVDKDSRNSDEKLFWTVCNRNHINIYSLDLVKACNCLKRWRADFNHKFMYLPTDPRVIKRRKLLEIICREEFSPLN